MSMTDSNSTNIGPIQLVRSIDAFAASVSKYLVPSIEYVGHKDELTDKLERQLAGITFRKTYKENDADLVIFDRIPEELFESDRTLPTDRSYLFYLYEYIAPSQKTLDALKKLNARVLVNPTTDEMLWNIKALLLLNDVSFASSTRVFPELMSVDYDFRNALQTLIKSVVENQNVVVSLSDDSILQSIDQFLFENAPSHIKPAEITATQYLNKSVKGKRYILMLDEPSKELLEELIARSNNTGSVFIAVSNAKMHLESKEDVDLLVCHVPSIESRKFDSELLAYWASSHYTITTGLSQYYTTAQIKQAIKKSADATEALVESIVKLKPNQKTIPKSLEATIAQFDRMSIDNILHQTEAAVMQYLRQSSDRVETASRAAGLPTITFQKRTKRFKELNNLISLHTQVLRHQEG